jgi:hypothetical protein
MADAEARLPGLFFAGSFRDGISAGNCLVAGDDMAGRVGRFLAAATRPEPSAQALLS